MAEVHANGTTFNVVRMDRTAAPGASAGGHVSRPPVVFLHGLIMDNLSSWYYTVAPDVAAITDVICYDLRGHGRSERPDTGYRLEDAVDDLTGILDALGVDEPVHLVGNSFGGTVALSAACRVPERVAGVVLVEGHPAFEGWADEMIDDLEDLVEGFEGPLAQTYLSDEAPRKLRRMARQCEALVAHSSMPDDFFDSELTTPERLAELDVPVFLLYGDSSDILDRALAMERAIPGAELCIVEGASHALLMEDPDKVRKHVLSWLESRR